MENKENQETDKNIEYDDLNDAINSFQKGIFDITLSAQNNLIKNSIFNKLNFYDLILIDTNSNFLDLKLKLEINTNKNVKTKVFVNKNVIQFTNFSDLSYNILEKINKNPSNFKISYFKDNLEKITSDFDLNNYFGETIFVKVYERNRNRFININKNNLIFNQNKFFNNSNRNLTNYSKSKKFTFDFESINNSDKENSSQALKTVENFFNKSENNVEKTVEGNFFPWNLSLRKYPEVINSTKNKVQRSFNNLFIKDGSKIGINFNEKNHGSKENKRINNKENILDEKNSDNSFNQNNDNNNNLSKKKFLKNDILFRNRNLINENLNIQENNINDRLGILNNFRNNNNCDLEKNTRIISNKEKEGDQSKLNPLQFIENAKNQILEKSSDKILTIFSAEKNKQNRKNLDFKSEFKLYYDNDKKSFRLIKVKKSIEKDCFNTINDFKNNSENNIKRDPKELYSTENEPTTPYVLTNQSFYEKIKSKSQLETANKKIIDDSIKDTPQNLNMKLKNNIHLTISKNSNFNPKKIEKKNISGSPLSRSHLFEKEFSSKKIKFTKHELSNNSKILIKNEENSYQENSNFIKDLSSEKISDKLLLRKSNLSLYKFNNFPNINNKSNDLFNNSYTRNKNSYNSNNISKMLNVKDKMFDVSGNYTANNFNTINLSKEIDKDKKNSTQRNLIPQIKNINNLKNSNQAIGNNSNHSVLEQKLFLNKTFSKNIFRGTSKIPSIYKNTKNKALKATTNSSNLENLFPCLINNNKTYKNGLNNLTIITLEKENDIKIIREKEKYPNHKIKQMKNFLDIQENPLDLDENFSNFMKRIDNNTQTSQLYNNIFSSSELENGKHFFFPQMNYKVHSKVEYHDKEYDHFKKDSCLFNQTDERKSNFHNQSMCKSGEQYLLKKPENLYISKYIPELDNKLINEINDTKQIIKYFIQNNLRFIISNNYIQENFRDMIIIKSSNQSDNKSIDLNEKKNESLDYSNNEFKESQKKESLEKIKLIQKSKIENEDQIENNLFTIENFESYEKNCDLAREFILYFFLNIKALEEFFMKKLNKFECSNSNNDDYNQSKTNFNFPLNKNKIKNSTLNVSLVNNVDLFNTTNRELALDFFKLTNNSKQISEFNSIVNKLIGNLKKDITEFLNFMNYLKLNKITLNKKIFALDMIFVNIYHINAKNKAIHEKILFALIEFISKNKEKKIFYQDYKTLYLLLNRGEFEKEYKKEQFYESKFLFLKNFLKMLVKKEEDYFNIIKKSFEITNEEIYFILYTDINEIKKHIDDEDFKSKISKIFNLLLDSLL